MIRPAVLICVVFFAQVSLAQGVVTEAFKVPNGSITIDGSLSEAFWSSSPINTVDQSKLTEGTTDGNQDCSAQFVALHDDLGVYIGCKFFDDIHNAPHSIYLEDANNGYDDDGFQYVLDNSYEDAVAGGTYQNAWTLVRGFANTVAADQYGGWWGRDDGSGRGWSTGVWTVPEQQDNGWTEVFASTNGLDFETEMRLFWNGAVMGRISAKGAGGTMAFDLVVNDNDGLFSTETRLRWTGQNWTWGASPAPVGQIVFQGMVNLKSVRPAMHSVKYASKTGVFCDVLGRRVDMQRPAACQVRLISNAPSRARMLTIK